LAGSSGGYAQNALEAFAGIEGGWRRHVSAAVGGCIDTVGVDQATEEKPCRAVDLKAAAGDWTEETVRVAEALVQFRTVGDGGGAKLSEFRPNLDPSFP
jgi:hypothetical protein